MKPSKITAAVFAATLAASTAAVAQGTSGQNAQSGSTGKQAAANTNAPVILLVPLTTAQDPNLANGCWARLYGDTNYTGNMLTLTGPVVIPDGASTVAGLDFGRNFDSVAVGRNATLVVYTAENFRDRSATFRPGQQVPDLDERMGFFQEIASLKLTCSNQQGQSQQR